MDHSCEFIGRSSGGYESWIKSSSFCLIFSSGNYLRYRGYSSDSISAILLMKSCSNAFSFKALLKPSNHSKIPPMRTYLWRTSIAVYASVTRNSSSLSIILYVSWATWLSLARNRMKSFSHGVDAAFKAL